MKVLRKAKENLFILFIAAAYIAMFIINQNMGHCLCQEQLLLHKRNDYDHAGHICSDSSPGFMGSQGKKS
jgi:hypothetical protein